MSTRRQRGIHSTRKPGAPAIPARLAPRGHGCEDAPREGALLDFANLFFLLIALIAVGTPVIALLAFLRARRPVELLNRLARVERRLAELEAARGEAAPKAERVAARAAAEPLAPLAQTARMPTRPRADELASREAERAFPEPAARRHAERGVVPDAAPRKSIDWERWIGVNGAATGGGIVGALGLVLLFRHAIEEGWLTPGLRVALGAISGTACIAGALVARRRELRHVPGALAGAGIVALYATAWAAHRLYALVPFAVAFAGMALVTALCIALALRLRAQVVALLGLAGGFCTPLLLDTGVDRPLALFGYLLVLDVGLLVVAARQRWPALALVGLGATFAYEVLWTLLHVGAQDVPLALVIAGAFALLFAFAGEFEGRGGLSARAGGLLLPFLLALHFGRSPDLAPSLWPTAALVALLACGSAVVARRMEAAWLDAASAGGALAVVFTWFARVERTGATVVELGAVSVGLALVFQLFAEWDRRRGREDGRAFPPETLLAGGFTLMTLVVAAGPVAPPLHGPWPLAAVWVILGLLLGRQARPAARPHPPFVGALGAGIGLALWANVHGGAPDFPGARVYGALVLGVAAIAFGAARASSPASRRVAWHAAGAFCVPLLAGLPSAEALIGDPLALALLLALALAMSLVALPTGFGAWCVLAVLLCALGQSVVPRAIATSTVDPIGAALTTSALGALSVLVFAALPLAVRFPEVGRFGGARAFAYRAAALAPIAWLPGLRDIDAYFWGLPEGVVPALLGCVALGVLSVARRREVASRRVALVWLAASGLFLLALAVPLQVGRHELPVAAAASAFAFAWLWRKLDHRGLAYLALAAAVTATCSTSVALAGVGEFERVPWPVFDWAGYGALLPGVLLLWASALLAGRAEEDLVPDRHVAARRSLPAATAGIGGLLAIFTWINLEIFDAFGAGTAIEIELERDPARDLALSIAWALYALAILGAGMILERTALRWASLAFLILSLGKVFLHDLGELEGLFRVASLCGLALSFFAVSVLYQRFVFRAPPSSDHTTP